MIGLGGQNEWFGIVGNYFCDLCFVYFGYGDKKASISLENEKGTNLYQGTR